MLDQAAIEAMTDDDLSALGVQRIAPDEPQMSTDQKVSGMIEALGGMPQSEDEMTPEQAELLENQFRQDTENRLYRIEKEVRAKYPNSTDNQQYEFAKAVMQAINTGETMAILEVTDKIHKTIREKQESQTKAQEKNLSVEGESTSGGTGEKGIPSLYNVIRNAATSMRGS